MKQSKASSLGDHFLNSNVLKIGRMVTFCIVPIFKDKFLIKVMSKLVLVFGVSSYLKTHRY